MKVSASAVSLMVDDPEASSRFLVEHFGFREVLAAPEEEWGERAFQVRDPNGVLVQLVDWRGEGSAEEWHAEHDG